MLDKIPQNPMDMLMIGSTIGLVFSLWIIGVVVWLMRTRARGEEIGRRLGLAQTPEEGKRELSLWIDGKVAHTTVPIGDRALSLTERLEQVAENAGLQMSPLAMILLTIGLTSLGLLIGYGLSESLIIGLGMAIAVIFILLNIVRSRANRVQILFEQQFLDALGLATRSLRAGHPLVGAFQLVAKEMQPPISRVFADICQQEALGIGLDRAIAKAAHKSNNEEMKLFATSVIIQLRSGGNLADMMERMAVVLRERMRLARRVRVLTAETQLSKNTLLALPFIIFILLSIINPAYTATLFNTEAGRIMIGIAAMGMLIGAIIMNRISMLRY